MGAQEREVGEMYRKPRFGFLRTVLIAPIKHWKVTLKHLAIGFMVLACIFVLFLGLLYLASLTRNNANTIVTTSVNVATTALDMLRLYRLGWNALSPLVPVVGGVWDRIFQITEALWLQARSYLCGVWPPTDMASDCPNLLELYGVLQDVILMIQDVVSLAGQLATLLIDAIQPFLCIGQSSTCSVTISDVINWIVEWLVWLIGTFMQAVSSVILFLANALAALAFPITADIKVLVQMFMDLFANLQKGLAMFALNVFTPIIDLVTCSAFVQPVPCIIKPACYAIFNILYIPWPTWMQSICIFNWCPFKTAAALSVDLSNICNSLGGTCGCSNCRSIYGSNCPCILSLNMNPAQNIGCKCYRPNTLYQYSTNTILADLGLYWSFDGYLYSTTTA